MKKIPANLKDFLKYRKMAFFFLQYLFFILEILAFLHYVNEESVDVMKFVTGKVKY